MVPALEFLPRRRWKAARGPVAAVSPPLREAGYGALSALARPGVRGGKALLQRPRGGAA